MLEFKNLKELLKTVSDEKVARKHMEEMRWGGSPFCPHCGCVGFYRLKDGKTYRCKSKECKKDYTVTVGTVFENSKIALSTWMAAVYLISAHKKGISSLQLSRDLGITQKSAWFVLHRVRFIMNDEAPLPLGNVVEIDETYVGGKVGNMSMGKRKKLAEKNEDNKTAVMGMVERDGKARLTVIGANSFKDVVRDNVSKDAVLITDTHLAYVGLSQEYADHQSVNHSKSEYRKGIAYTNTVEGFFSCLKRSIYGCYHSVSPKHLQRYCSETSFRYNSRNLLDAERFNYTLQKVEGRLTYSNLIKK